MFISFCSFFGDCFIERRFLLNFMQEFQDCFQCPTLYSSLLFTLCGFRFPYFTRRFWWSSSSIWYALLVFWYRWMASTFSRTIGLNVLSYFFNLLVLAKIEGYWLAPTFNTVAVLDLRRKTWMTPQAPSDSGKLYAFISSSILSRSTFIAQGILKWSSEWMSHSFRHCRKCLGQWTYYGSKLTRKWRHSIGWISGDVVCGGVAPVAPDVKALGDDHSSAPVMVKIKKKISPRHCLYEFLGG